MNLNMKKRRIVNLHVFCDSSLAISKVDISGMFEDAEEHMCVEEEGLRGGC
jgi:hypothetical protein